MMQFKTSGAYEVATNSIKRVAISRSIEGYIVSTPEGRLLDEVKRSGPFETFEKAKRDAECHVGMKMNFK